MQKLFLLLTATFLLNIQVQAQLKEKMIRKMNAKNYQKQDDESLNMPIHQKYMNQLVFSDTDIVYNAYNEDRFITEYTLGEPLFFRAFLDRSFYNKVVDLASDQGILLDDDANNPNLIKLIKYKITIFKDEQPLFEYMDVADRTIMSLTFPGAFYLTAKEQLSYSETILMTADDKRKRMLYPLFRSMYEEKREELTENFDMRIRFEILYTSDYYNTSNIIPVINESNLFVEGHLKWIYDPALELEEQYEYTIENNDWNGKMKAPKIVSEAMETLTKTYHEKRWKPRTWTHGFITYDDWQIARHELTGRILYRYINVAICSTSEDGKHFGINDYQFNQNYDGDRFFGELMYAGEGRMYDVSPDFVDYIKKKGH